MSSSPHLPSSEAGDPQTKFLCLMADSWGAVTKQSPLKINELNDGSEKRSWWWSGREGPWGWQKEEGWTPRKWQWWEPLSLSPLPSLPSPSLPPPVASPSTLLSSREPRQIERQGDYEDVSWSVGRREGSSAPDEVRGEPRRVTHGRPCVCVWQTVKWCVVARLRCTWALHLWLIGLVMCNGPICSVLFFFFYL